MYLEYPAWVIGEAVPLALQDTYYIRPHYQDTEAKQLYLICRNKYKEAAKTRMAQMKEQIKTPEKELNEKEISNSQRQSSKLVIRMLKEIREELSSIKKTQAETKDTLIEIRTIYRRTIVEWCVAACQGLAGPGHWGGWKIFLEPLGCLVCLCLRVGELHMPQPCLPACLCVAHVMAPCSPAWHL